MQAINERPASEYIEATRPGAELPLSVVVNERIMRAGLDPLGGISRRDDYDNVVLEDKIVKVLHQDEVLALLRDFQ
jgi:hypothetical protein